MHLRTVIVTTAALIAVLIGLATSLPVQAAGGAPVAAYSFDEGAGTTVHDASLQGNDGTTQDTMWSTAGRSGRALAFNGSSSWVTVSDAPSLDLTRGFTLEAWVKPAADLGASWATILFKEQLNDLVYGLYANSDTASPAGVMSVPSGTAATRGLAPLPANVWSFVAASWDGSTMRLFVNGTKVAIQSVSGTLPVSSGPLRIGGNGVRGEWFDGLIDDVRIYDQSISGTNIRIDMDTPVSPTLATPPPVDVTPPTTPTGLAAANVAVSAITTTWTPSTDNVGVAGYNLFQDGLFVGTSSAPVFTFTGLLCATSYVLGVEAFDAAGGISGRESITVSTLACPDTAAPSVPSSFAPGVIGTDSIATSWTASTDNVGVAGYTLYRDGVGAGTTTSTSFTFGALSCGTSYTLGVQAFDAAGNTSAVSTIATSTASCPDTSAPSAPPLLATGATTTTSIDASWAPSVDNVAVAGYTLSVNGGTVGTTTATAFTFVGLVCGTSYTLAVQAFDAAGNTSAVSSITASTAACPDTTPPSAPTALAETSATGTSIATSWVASTDNVAVSGYTVYLDGAVAGTTTATTFIVGGLTCGTSHTVGVEAFDAAGNVSARATATAPTAACPDVTAPSAPTGLVAKGVTKTSIGLFWTASTDNVGVAGYQLYRGGVNIGTTTATSFNFAGLSCGSIYVLAVAAFDAAGNISTRPAITAATASCGDITPPTAPGSFAVGAITTTSIATSWAASTDNVGVTGYRVFLDGVSAGTTTATAFTFTGLACGTSPTLGVQAFDAAGNLSSRSTLTASTVACPDTSAPSAPTGLAAAGAATSIAASWTASTDNVGVSGYTVYLDGAVVGTTTATSFTVGGLTCGTSHTLGIDAFDSAGNLSLRTSITATTSGCPDTTPPSAPPAFAVTSLTTTSITTSWSPSTDNVGVAGYTLYRDGVSAGTVSGASVATAASGNFSFLGLSCGTSYTLGIEAFDAAGNISLRQSIGAATSPCPDTTPPQVALTAPAAGATVAGAVQLVASATDAAGVASVQFTVDGTPVGVAVTAAPYTFSWDSLGAPNGTHALGARATDVSGNTAASAPVTVTVQNGFDTTNAFNKVDIGPGFVDASLHSVVRTAGGRVYVFAADDTAERKATGPGVIHAYRADQLGIPTSFTEADAAHRPSATGTTHVVGSPDVRLDASGVAHMVYTDETNATLWYETFSTVTDTWGPRVSLATGVNVPLGAIKRDTSNALVLDKNDVPHVAYAGGGVVQYRNLVGGSWSVPVTISSGGTPVHVGLAAAPDGTIDLSWLQGRVAPSSIMFAQRSPLGAWSPPETVSSGDVLDNSNLDQGPSVAFSSSNEAYVLYVSALPSSAVRVRHRAGGAWPLDPTPSDFFTHTPQIYMQGNDVYAFLGHDSQIRFAYAYHLAGQAWSPLTALTSTVDGTLDGSASIRFDPMREPNAGIIDATFFDEDLLNNKTYFPEAYYMAVVPSGTGAAPPGPADATPPTVALTAPAGGATVTGTAVAVSANASDNVGVAGVQFKLDGANLGAEDTTAPYSVTWDSTIATNGTHTLTAVARDAAGNATTAASVTVTVSNASAPPPAAGTVLVGNAATESKIDFDAAGEAEAFKAIAATTGSVASLRVFVDAGSTAGSIVVGLYSNNAGHPGTLLTSGTITAPAAGQNNAVPVAAAPVTAGQTYWIAILGRSGVVTFRDRGAVGMGNSEASLQTTLTSLPAIWSSGTPFTDGLLSAVGLG